MKDLQPSSLHATQKNSVTKTKLPHQTCFFDSFMRDLKDFEHYVQHRGQYGRIAMMVSLD